MEIRILPAARARLLEIWSYTESTWGEAQADLYVSELVAAIRRHAANRDRWKPVLHPSLRGVYRTRQALHFLFFKELGDGTIGVISILHESMDIPARLRDDTE